MQYIHSFPHANIFKTLTALVLRIGQKRFVHRFGRHHLVLGIARVANRFALHDVRFGDDLQRFDDRHVAQLVGDVQRCLAGLLTR